MARILIVDDALMARNILGYVLEMAGHEVAGSAANGREALAVYGKLQPDLVTMDIRMPVMDGITSLRKLLERDPDARAIMISALDPAEYEAQSLDAGALGYVYKPRIKAQLPAALAAALAG